MTEVREAEEPKRIRVREGNPRQGLTHATPPQVETPIGVKPLAEVCQDIEATFGPGPVGNRIFFNTIQCGHGGLLHRHSHGDGAYSVFDQTYFDDGIEVEVSAARPGAQVDVPRRALNFGARV